jgi:hypothetical protein
MFYSYQNQFSNIKPLVQAYLLVSGKVIFGMHVVANGTSATSAFLPEKFRIKFFIWPILEGRSLVYPEE